MDNEVPPIETYSPAAMLCLSSCEYRETAPGKVFWIALRENEFFTAQSHKAENKPKLFGSMVTLVRGAWTQNNAPFRILINPTRDTSAYEIGIAENKDHIWATWDWLEEYLVRPLKQDQTMNSVPAKLSWLRNFFSK